MNKLIVVLLLLILVMVSANFMVYMNHLDSNWCAAEVEYVKHGMFTILQHLGLPGLAD
tara:strand:+ start:2635 stop:2808 length:174 start_codon:yes stop_codon:yes gene_type:complete